MRVIGSFQTITFQPNSRWSRSWRPGAFAGAGALVGVGAEVVAMAPSVAQVSPRVPPPIGSFRPLLELPVTGLPRERRRSGCAEVDDARPRGRSPRRLGCRSRGRRCHSVEHRLQRKLAVVAHDPDGTRLAHTSFETMALAAFLAGDGHSHFVAQRRTARATPR